MGDIVGGKRFVGIDPTPETVPGVPNSPANWKYVEAESQGFDIDENPVFDNVEVEANMDTQPAEEPAGFEPQGGLKIVPAPFVEGGENATASHSWMWFVLNWALTRSSNVLNAHTVDNFYPITDGEFARRVTGAKVDSIKLAWGQNDRMANPALSIKGMYPEPYVPGTMPTPTFPSLRHWNFTFLGAQAGGEYSGGAGGIYTSKYLRALEITANNALKNGAMGYRWSNGAPIMGLESIDESELEITGSFETKLQNYNWINRLVSGGKGHFRLLGFHPKSPMSQIQDVGGISTDPASATVDIEVATGDGALYSDGDTVYLEDSSDANPAEWVKEVAEVASVSGDVLTCYLQGQGDFIGSIGRNQTFTQNSMVIKNGIQLMIRDFTLRKWKPLDGVKDKIYQRVEFKAGTWVGTHPTHGANYAFPALDWMVR